MTNKNNILTLHLHWFWWTFWRKHTFPCNKREEEDTKYKVFQSGFTAPPLSFSPACHQNIKREWTRTPSDLFCSSRPSTQQIVASTPALLLTSLGTPLPASTWKYTLPGAPSHHASLVLQLSPLLLVTRTSTSTSASPSRWFEASPLNGTRPWTTQLRLGSLSTLATLMPIRENWSTSALGSTPTPSPIWCLLPNMKSV